MAAQTGTTVITIRHPNDAIEAVYTRKQETLANLEDYLGAFGNGAKGLGGSIDVQQSTSSTVAAVGAVGSDAVAASGTLTLSTSSGTVGGVINGVTITVTFDTDDDTTAGLIATEINDSTDALVAGLVTAEAAAGVVTVTATVAGVTGNCITLAKSGTGVTASGARLTGGVDATAKLLTY
jgi:hypothetical protein